MASQTEKRELMVTGMTCGHCRAAVETAIREVPGVESVHVDLERGRASVEGNVELQSLIQAVEEAGYQALPEGDA
jgi:copper chaperone